MKKLLSLVLAALFCLSACALAEETPVTVKVGVVGSTNEQWTDVLVPKLAEEGRKKELNFLHGISQSKWGIRGAVNVYNNAVNNEDISYDGLYAMARTMGIGLV